MEVRNIRNASKPIELTFESITNGHFFEYRGQLYLRTRTTELGDKSGGHAFRLIDNTFTAFAGTEPVKKILEVSIDYKT